MSRIRIGNQTANSASRPTEPFDFALANGFDAFEWFSDKKIDNNGNSHGWEESDFNEAQRAELRRIGKERDIFFSVHAPWQANPLEPHWPELLRRSLDFARDIGSSLVNLHLYMENGASAYVNAMLPVLEYARQLRLRVSIENTPLTTPGDFNQTFELFWSSGRMERSSLGMCLDIGHANLCVPTRNDFLRYIDELSHSVPIIHLHVHENFGDADTHLPLFAGPAGRDDAGIRGFIDRMQKREYAGAMILEQWPQPPSMLTDAARRLRSLIDRNQAPTNT